MIDKFYTKETIVDLCLLQISLQEYESIIEPSAGNGSFSKKIKCYAFDLEPEEETIIKANFFEIDLSKFNSPILIIGNPPFGKRSKLAIDFFNKSAEFASTIAFILPLQFRKWSVQSKLNENFILETDINIPENSFFYGNKSFDINCCFQIWHNKNFKETKDLRIKIAPLIKHKDFEMWQYNNTKQALKYFDKEKYKWDFAVPRQGFYDYKKRIVKVEELDKKIQWIFFKAENEKILYNLLNMDFEKISKKNTTIPGFGKADIVEEYSKLYG